MTGFRAIQHLILAQNYGGLTLISIGSFFYKFVSASIKASLIGTFI